jgi:hypothetical protein
MQYQLALNLVIARIFLLVGFLSILKPLKKRSMSAYEASDACVCEDCTAFFSKILKPDDQRLLPIIAEHWKFDKPGRAKSSSDNCIGCWFTALIQQQALSPELPICAIFESHKSDPKFSTQKDGTLRLSELTYEVWFGAKMKCSIISNALTDSTFRDGMLKARLTSWYNRWGRGEKKSSDVTQYPGQKSNVKKISSATSSTGSKETLQVVASWLKQCETSHALCRSKRFTAEGSEKWKPTRLIDLSASHVQKSTICLRERQHVPPGCQYAAVSYCWGMSPSFLTLTRSTRRHLLEGIEISDLPRTWEETIQILRELSIQYLWIDALCIMQDDEEDWKRESASMSQIFGAAMLTISATASFNADEGLFRERPNALVKGVTLPLQSTTGSSWRLSYAGSDPGLPRFNSYPIAKRGWTLQEWLLSSRMLHFTDNIVSWECLEGSASEYDTTIQSYSPQNQTLKANVSKLMTQPTGSFDFHTVWNDILYDYTRRGFTNPGDKLFALQGLEKEFSSRFAMKDVYVAGMWKGTLLTDLLWATAELKESKANLSIAPSWSWAAVEGSVYFLSFHDSETIKNPLVQIINASWSLNSSSNARRAQGRLRLRGVLWEVGVRSLHQVDSPKQDTLEVGGKRLRQKLLKRNITLFGQQKNDDDLGLELFAVGKKSKGSMVWINLSFPDALTDDKSHFGPIFFVPFYIMDQAATSTGTHDVGGCPIGLLVRFQGEERGVYVRIGSGYFIPDHPYKTPMSFVRWTDDVEERLYIERESYDSYVFDLV